MKNEDEVQQSTPKEGVNDEVRQQLVEFEARCRAAWERLFTAARDRNEVYFAISLLPELRGSEGAGWNTAEESKIAFEQYLELLEHLTPKPVKIRVALSFYSHLSEAAGFYEVPMNMLLVADGQSYDVYPFQHLAREHRKRGIIIAPNANKIMQDLVDHAQALGHDDLCAIIVETFDPDLRNGYAHADYIIWNNDIRLRKRYGGNPRTVTQKEFVIRLNKAITFFQTLWRQSNESIVSYTNPKEVVGRLNDEDCETTFVIAFDPQRRSLSISG